MPKDLPVYISGSIRDHFIQCQSENPGVLVIVREDESVRDSQDVKVTMFNSITFFAGNLAALLHSWYISITEYLDLNTYMQCITGFNA